MDWRLACAVAGDLTAFDSYADQSTADAVVTDQQAKYDNFNGMSRWEGPATAGLRIPARDEPQRLLGHQSAALVCRPRQLA